MGSLISSFRDININNNINNNNRTSNRTSNHHSNHNKITKNINYEQEEKDRICEQMFLQDLGVIDVMVLEGKPIPSSIEKSKNQKIKEYLDKYECDVCLEYKIIEPTYCGCNTKYCIVCFQGINGFCKICDDDCKNPTRKIKFKETSKDKN